MGVWVQRANSVEGQAAQVHTQVAKSRRLARFSSLLFLTQPIMLGEQSDIHAPIRTGFRPCSITRSPLGDPTLLPYHRPLWPAPAPAPALEPIPTVSKAPSLHLPKPPA
jgi:hypothetical protein